MVTQCHILNTWMFRCNVDVHCHGSCKFHVAVMFKNCECCWNSPQQHNYGSWLLWLQKLISFHYDTSEHTFLALVTITGRLATMSVMLRLNQPSSPSPVVTPVASRPASEEKPDLYCVMANMSSVKCAVGCANLNNSLLVCGQCFIYIYIYIVR